MFNFGISKQDSEAKSTSFSNPVKLDLYDQNQQNIFNNLAGIVQSGLNSPIPSYPKDMYVPRQPEEQNYFNLANKDSGQIDSRITALNNVLSGNAAYDINPEITKNYFDKSIAPIMNREFYGKTLPAIDQNFAGPGYWGSARSNAKQTATSDYATNLGATEANLVYADELARRTSLENAANRQASTALNAVQSSLNSAGTAGQYARSIQEEQTLSDYQRWLAGETVDGVTPVQNNPYLQLAYQFLGLQPYTYGTQSGGKSTSNSSGFGFSLGVLSNSSANSGSDIRIKTNVNALMKMVPIMFDYLPEFGSPGQIGFVADDIENVAPGMVSIDDKGIKRINHFAIITLLVQAVQELNNEIEELKRNK